MDADYKIMEILGAELDDDHEKRIREMQPNPKFTDETFDRAKHLTELSKTLKNNFTNKKNN